ncbi:MAG: type II secretion system minor pseudopilin GspI [Mariprofundaceae bacterium]|nr:type II secretion system minor pseudopilin GspI [Mariprofundaceae bacterium]
MNARGPDCGFTLLEVLVALAIAATALVVLMGRVGSSADIQRDLALHAEAMGVAVNELERIRLKAVPAEDVQGEVETASGLFRWQSKQVSTLDAGFVRQNMVVTAPDGGTVKLFLYRSLP